MVFVKNWPFLFRFIILGKIVQRNVFYDILKRKDALLGYKNKKFKKSKNWRFSKGSMVFVKNWPFFHRFILGNIVRRNVFYDILERKNAFLGSKSKKLKESQNWRFFKGSMVLIKNWPFYRLFILGNIRALIKSRRGKKRCVKRKTWVRFNS